MVLFKVYIKRLRMLFTLQVQESFFLFLVFNWRANGKKMGFELVHIWICLYKMFLANTDKEAFTHHCLFSHADSIKINQWNKESKEQKVHQHSTGLSN